jgi:hypothetical protein
MLKVNSPQTLNQIKNTIEKVLNNSKYIEYEQNNAVCCAYAVQAGQAVDMTSATCTLQLHFHTTHTTDLQRIHFYCLSIIRPLFGRD